MQMKILLIITIVLLAFLFSCSQESTPGQKTPALETPTKETKAAEKTAPGGWQAEWERTLAEAKKEGKVIVYTGVPPITRQELTGAFKKKYPEIDLEFVAGGGAELSQRIFAQRRAGLNMVDLYISGATTIITVLKPAKVLDPFEPMLILPQVSDPKVWWQGRLPFVDKDHTVFSFMAGPGAEGNILVNTEVIKPEEINSYYDLLNPRFKEKIVMIDPTTTGKGERQVVVLAEKSGLGWDFFRELAKQRPVLTRNARLQAEWIANKKFLVGFSPDEGVVLEFREAGSPIKIFGGLKEDVFWVTGSFGIVGLVSGAPHINASKVFVNWLLDQEAQEIWARTTLQQSARIDVSVEHMNKAGKAVRQPGVSYYNSEDEEVILRYPELQKTIREIFGPLLK